MTLTPELQSLVDRAAIHDVLMRYFHAADCGDKSQVRSCFTEDVKAQYHGRSPLQGADALIGQIALFDAFASGACKIATHFVGNLQYKVLGADHAETEANAFAFLVRPGAASDQVAMRSLRYLDRWVHRGDGWKISERLHTLDWHCELPASTAATIAQRVNAFPSQPPSKL